MFRRDVLVGSKAFSLAGRLGSPLRVILSLGAALGGAACSFAGGTGTGATDAPDAAPGSDSSPDAKPPGPPRCAFTYVNVCDLTAGSAITYQANATINTSTDASCTHVIPQGNGKPELCVIHAASISVASGVTVRGVGSRPLVFVSSASITIDGRIDVSSARANGGTAESIGAGGEAVACGAFAKDPDSDAGGGGGGAGGGFSGQGADGATGDNGNGKAGRAANSIPGGESTFARGGCRGQTGGGSGGSANGGDGGAGGPPGGALYLAAAGDISITASGRVTAQGGGGQGGGSLAGGGGGGSGGWLTLEATKLHRLGVVSANGGGGGEGGEYVTAPLPAKVPGSDGSDGLSNGAAAPGGDNVLIGGRGGDGSAGSNRKGGGAGASFDGGGGGGGGAGYVRLLGTVDGAGVLSPPST
jgi:hypothetical protein